MVLYFSILFFIFFCAWILSQGLAMQLRMAHRACTLPASFRRAGVTGTGVCANPGQCCWALFHRQPSLCSSAHCWLETGQLTKEAAQASGLGRSCAAAGGNHTHQPINSCLSRICGGGGQPNPTSMLLLSFPNLL